MQGSSLAIYFKDIVHFERKLEICREILAQNMNFSPTWLIILMTAESETQSGLSISNFDCLFQNASIKLSQEQVVHIFDYFDTENKERVQNKAFINLILPTNREGLRKAALKRIAEDLEMTDDLKYALKRFFLQILDMRRILLTYSFRVNGEAQLSQDHIQKEEIQEFMNKYGKYPTESQLNILEICIAEKRLKQISFDGIRTIFKQAKQTNIKVVQSVKRQVLAKKSANKISNPINDISFSQSRNNQTEISEKVSSIKSRRQIQNEEELKKAKQIANNLLQKNNQTPFNSLKENNDSLCIYRPTTSKGNLKGLQTPYESRINSEAISRLQYNNQLLQSEVTRDKVQNEQKLKTLKSRLQY